MHLKRLLNTSLGNFFISVLLGLGLATLFRKACTDKNCISFHGPVITNVDGKTYKHGEKCYQYVSNATSCDANKQIVDIAIEEHNREPPVSLFSGVPTDPTIPARSSGV
jgi:hypothetical protein